MHGAPKKRKTHKMEFSPPEPLLTGSQVNQMATKVSDYRSVLLDVFRSEKQSDRYGKLQEAIIGIDDTLRQLTNAYLHLLAADSLTRYFQHTLTSACESLTEVSAGIKDAASTGVLGGPSSYARIVTAPNQKQPAARVSLAWGKTFPINQSERIIIAPTDAVKERLSSSEATKAALMKAVDPVALKLNIKPVRFGPSNSVVA